MTTRPIRTPVTRERITQVALALIDAEGTAAVTMRRVAGGLGVQAPSLYEHVRGRDEILALAHAAVVRGVGPIPSTGDWLADLRDFYTRLHAAFLAHGDIASLQFGAIPAGDDSVAAFLAAIDSLVASGLPRALAMRATERLSLYVTADAYEQWEFRRRAEAGEVAPTNEMIVGLYDGSPGEGSAVAFQFGLDLMLDGLAYAARAQRASGAG